MLKKALKDNKTLHIIKDKEYEMFKFMEVSLVVVINELGDEVVMWRHHFEE